MLLTGPVASVASLRTDKLQALPSHESRSTILFIVPKVLTKSVAHVPGSSQR